MDKYYASFVGPSTPNHLFIQSATSAGCTTTGATYHCDGSSFPQKTIYEALAEANKTWAYYYNDTAWNTFLEWFNTPRGAAGVKPYDDFYSSAQAGDLPNFAFILPRQGTNETTGDGPNDGERALQPGDQVSWQITRVTTLRLGSVCSRILTKCFAPRLRGIGRYLCSHTTTLAGIATAVRSESVCFPAASTIMRNS